MQFFTCLCRPGGIRTNYGYSHIHKQGFRLICMYKTNARVHLFIRLLKKTKNILIRY